MMKCGTERKVHGRVILPVGGSVLLTNKKMAFSGASVMCFLISNTNFPTVISEGTKYFFLSISGASVLGAFSTITYDDNHQHE